MINVITDMRQNKKSIQILQVVQLPQYGTSIGDVAKKFATSPMSGSQNFCVKGKTDHRLLVLFPFL